MLFKRNRSYQPGQISVSDPEVRTKISFHGLTEDDLGVIKSWSDVCRNSLDRLIDKFYAYISSSSEAIGILQKNTTIERQRPMLSRYVLTLFDGHIDDSFVAYRQKVGQVHDRIALDSHWYIAMYEVMRQFLVDEIENSGASKKDLKLFRNALNRLLMVDMAFVLMSQADTYKDKITNLSADVEAKLNEAKTFLDEEARVLEMVSTRNLATRMEGEFEGQYAELKKMLNLMIENLYDSISQISLGAGQVSEAANEISSSSQSLAQGASDQAATLEEMTANFQEMVSMSTRNADNAKVVTEMTQSAFSSTERGGKSMNDLSEAINKIQASSNATAKIVKTIEEIAFQTNLLALNAAVEAARAGDAGKGFAVVAEEVRNLAMRSAEAAKTTAQLIEESVNNAQSGVRYNEQVMENLTEIRGHVEKVSQMMNDISAESSSQHKTVEQISNAIEQINDVTQQVAASSEETASAAEELSGQSQEMLELINSYELGTHKSNNKTPHKPKPNARQNIGFNGQQSNMTKGLPKKTVITNGNGKNHSPFSRN